MKRKRLASRIAQLFASSSVTEETFDELEDALIEGDVGVQLTSEVMDELRRERSLRRASDEMIVQALRTLLSRFVKGTELVLDENRLNIVLVLGVNGVGKTTAIARLAHHFSSHVGLEQIALCAGDTFRAAAIEQLSIHADRLSVRIVKQSHGSDAGAVIYDAIESAHSRGDRLLLADTAGRMHNKSDLVTELEKIDRIIGKQASGDLYHRLLVIDATTGQNGLRQAEVFHDAVGVDSIFIAKYDSSGKGGTALSIARQLDIPISFLGTGETYESIEKFDPREYLETLIG